jgi:hypothetical protein
LFGNEKKKNVSSRSVVWGIKLVHTHIKKAW